MKCLYLLCFIFLLFPSTYLYAQLDKGLWMLNGEFNMTNYNKSVGRTKSSFLIHPKVAFMISPKIMIGGQLRIEILDKQAIVSNKLLARHYFKNLEAVYFFYGIELEWESDRSLLPGTAGNRFSYFRNGLLLGADVFLNKNVALELKMDYILMSFIKPRGRGSYISDFQYTGLSFKVGMQFFFGSKLDKNKEDKSLVLDKGLWMIGGNMTFSKILNRFNDRIVNQLSPRLAYFVKKNVALGMEITYFDLNSYRLFDVRFSPLSRFYFSLNDKRKIFTELKLGYGARWISTPQREYEISSSRLSGALSIGYSTMFSHTSSFDILIGYFYEKDKWDPKPLTKFEIGIGIQGFFKKKA